MGDILLAFDKHVIMKIGTGEWVGTIAEALLAHGHLSYPRGHGPGWLAHVQGGA